MVLDGSKFVIHGGVKLYDSEVLSKSCLADERGTTRYTVNFKNGVKASYMKGDGNGLISSRQYEAGEFKDNATNAYGIMGLEIKGTSNARDIIEIQDSEVICVDVSNDNEGDIVKVTNSKPTIGEAVLNVLDDHGPEVSCGEILVDNKDNVFLNNNQTFLVSEE